MAHFAKDTRKVLCVLRNFRAHAKELGNPVPKEPLFFLKPPSSIITEPHPIWLPAGHEIHNEVELGIVIGEAPASLRSPSQPGAASGGARNVPESEASGLVAGYFLALDLTARDMQAKAKASGMPWTAAKGFDTFCPVSAFVPADKVPDPERVLMSLRVNGALRQRGACSDMVFSIPALIAAASKFTALQPNDVILTGTPAGVGPLHVGDVVEGEARLLPVAPPPTDLSEDAPAAEVDVDAGDRLCGFRFECITRPE
eukprot:TRINITY_DN4570_c0_g1_i1.p2 TRINITY_DN4570_c0_g1~~TRINITY_DN4570_c0_g1_i1.p2  ORF type:complete len:291 (+),score=29.08 TRINITY_DN4570_c0_g1_i1:104-874(+)